MWAKKTKNRKMQNFGGYKRSVLYRNGNNPPYELGCIDMFTNECYRSVLDHVFKQAEYNVFTDDDDEVEINELGDKI